MTKQSVLAGCEIASGVRPRNDGWILFQVNNSLFLLRIRMASETPQAQ